MSIKKYMRNVNGVLGSLSKVICLSRSVSSEDTMFVSVDTATIPASSEKFISVLPSSDGKLIIKCNNSLIRIGVYTDLIIESEGTEVETYCVDSSLSTSPVYVESEPVLSGTSITKMLGFGDVSILVSANTQYFIRLVNTGTSAETETSQILFIEG